MNIGIVGGREFNNYALVENTMNHIIHKCNIDVSCIVSGGAYGADKLGETYANNNNIRTLIFKPDWEKHGKSAGYKRNVDIVTNSDIVIAFWDGKSKGTKHSIDISIAKNKSLIVIFYKINKYKQYNAEFIKTK